MQTEWMVEAAVGAVLTCVLLWVQYFILQKELDVRLLAVIPLIWAVKLLARKEIVSQVMNRIQK